VYDANVLNKIYQNLVVDVDLSTDETDGDPIILSLHKFLTGSIDRFPNIFIKNMHIHEP